MIGDIIRSFRARPLLLIATLLAVLIYFILPGDLLTSTRLVLAWDAFLLIYLCSMSWFILSSDLASIKQRAAIYDEGSFTILVLSVGAALASLVTVVIEMAAATTQARYTGWQLGLTGVTVGLSWVFVHVIFALHYAHDFYNTDEGKTLDFPGEANPIYGDFLYFSFIIGCACATADVNILARDTRRTALVHGILALFFNTAIVALSINIAAGLIGK